MFFQKRKSVILVAAVKTDADWKEGLRAVEEGLMGRSSNHGVFRLRFVDENFRIPKMPSKRRATRHIKALRPIRSLCNR